MLQSIFVFVFSTCKELLSAQEREEIYATYPIAL